MMDRRRKLITLRGTREETRESALETLSNVDPSGVLWVGEDSPAGSHATLARKVSDLLGRSFDVVVLSLHEGLDADALGQCHGFVWGGGALVLRLPTTLEAGQERLAAFPFGPEDVGVRFFRRLLELDYRADGEIRPIHRAKGTLEQEQVVESIRARLANSGATISTLVADRGRGKSAALGLALSGFESVLVVAEARDAAREVFRFAGERAFLRPVEALESMSNFDIVVVDEAARVPVPVLQALVRRFPNSHIVFATTTHGYEGTGRGFVLKFIDWLRQDPRPLEEFTLDEPIRWASEDPVEEAVFDALLLNADAADLSDVVPSSDRIQALHLDRDVLARDERLLREFFGLLVHAHYRTTPGDLHRLLDAPNLDLHALLLDGHVVGATWVAHEGALDQERIEDVYRGRIRLRGHALAESIVGHLAHPEFGGLTMKRSVRIAIHPELRRRRLGTKLVEHVHASYPSADLFGTVFGATAELIRFRRQVGYELVRVGASRGARTGEPSVVMIRAVSEQSRSLRDALRREFARDIESQIAFLHEDGVLLDDALLDALRKDLPEPAVFSAEEMARLVDHYVSGPRTFEAAATALKPWVEAREEQLSLLPEREAALIRARVLDWTPWKVLREELGYESIHATMRALRRALREFRDLL